MGTLSWVHFPPPLGVLIRLVRRLRRRAGRSGWRGHSGAGRGTWGHGNEKARTDGRTKRVCRTRVASSCISANQQPMACKISNFDHLAKNQLLQQHIHRPNEDMLSKNKFFSDALYQSFFDFHRHPSLTWLRKKQVTTNSGVWCRLHTEKTFCAIDVKMHVSKNVLHSFTENDSKSSQEFLCTVAVIIPLV